MGVKIFIHVVPDGPPGAGAVVALAQGKSLACENVGTLKPGMNTCVEIPPEGRIVILPTRPVTAETKP